MWIAMSCVASCLLGIIAGLFVGKQIQLRYDEAEIRKIDEAHANAMLTMEGRLGARKRAHEEANAARDNFSNLWLAEGKRADAAEARAKDATAQAIAAIQESRQAINEAVGMAKIAAASMFGTDVGDVEPAPSVGQADRMAAIRLREAQQSARR